MEHSIQMEALILVVYKLMIAQPRLMIDQLLPRGTPSVFVPSNPAENQPTMEDS